MSTRQEVIAYLADEPVRAFEFAVETMTDYAEVELDRAMQLEALTTAIAKLQAYAKSL